MLLNYLYNRGVAVLTLHDGIDAQRDYAELHQTPFQLWSHFGDYHHNCQKVVPTLKYFSASTFFASFLESLTYEQLETCEGTLGATYCPDLLDLLLGLFAYMGIVPPLHFGANIDALTPVLLRGCHREPNDDIISMLHTTMEFHESPEAFYSRTFLQLLRIPALKNLGFSQEDVHCLGRLSATGPHEFTFASSIGLSSLSAAQQHVYFTSCPQGQQSTCSIRFSSAEMAFPVAPGTTDPPPPPPPFHVWITRKVAPHMAVVDLRCDPVPWACFRRGSVGQHQFGLIRSPIPVTSLQFIFPGN